MKTKEQNSTNLPDTLSHYTTDKNAQIVLALLKAHNIRKIIVSPGATNITIARSAQNDSFFTLYSAIDERSAAYMACGLCEESGEAVALSCTGATAARNYMSALTEAYYRKTPYPCHNFHAKYRQSRTPNPTSNRQKPPATRHSPT